MNSCLLLIHFEAHLEFTSKHVAKHSPGIPEQLGQAFTWNSLRSSPGIHFEARGQAFTWNSWTTRPSIHLEFTSKLTWNSLRSTWPSIHLEFLNN